VSDGSGVASTLAVADLGRRGRERVAVEHDQVGHFAWLDRPGHVNSMSSSISLPGRPAAHRLVHLMQTRITESGLDRRNQAR
jgi:hypothetical protein